MNLFERLFAVSDSVVSLDDFLNENMHLVNDIYNSDYSSILLSKDSIVRFILFKANIIEQLDFQKSYNRAFILILLDFCERFNFIAATPRIYSILEKNDISIGLRLQAALSFLYPKPKSNSELVEKFELICEKIQISIEMEEDNDIRALSTFLNYYAVVINDTRLKFAEQVKQKIKNSIEKEDYPFLKNRFISDALSVDLLNTDFAFHFIQQIIDKLLDKKSKEEINTADFEEVLIEAGTEYSKSLAQAYKSFDSIRAISVRQSDGKAFTNRGVKILDSEKELFAYMRRVGNMHEAKLKDALESIPQMFPSKVLLIDWGCGQGIASMVFLEKFGSGTVNNIILIEPSKIALERATLHIRKYEPKVPIKTICKKLDELTESDLIIKTSNITIHLFSNILDVDDYSQNKLIELIKVSQSGENYFVCVSPCIDEIKSDRLDSFKRYFENKYKERYKFLEGKTNSKSDDKYWNCNNNYNGNMNGRFCPYPHPTCGCENKWTRVIRVFKVEL